MTKDARAVVSSSAKDPRVIGSNGNLDLGPANLSESFAQRRSLSLYLLPIVALPLLMFVSAFCIVPTQWFRLHSGNAYLANLGYGATLFNRNCQVLIYGDSSALVGLDPAVIQQQTGLATCNIAEFEGVTLVSHTFPVDTFLEHNPRPRFVIFLYTPEDLSIPSDWTSFDVGTFEAVTFQMERARNLNTAVLLASHPSVTFGWAEQGLRMLVEHIHSSPVSFDAAHIRDTTNGQLPITGTTVAKCDGDLRDRLPDEGWINNLRNRYGTNGTRVIVDATPTVDCDPSLQFFQQHLDGLIDNTPYKTIPLSSFSSDGRLHANQQGSRLISTMVANQIIGQLYQAPGTASARDIGDR